MTVITIKKDGEILTGFTVEGHSGYAEQGEDIVCAAVSSAAYMTVNTISEVLSLPVDADVRDGFMDITVLKNSNASQDILMGFELHIKELGTQYPQFIKISTEV